MKLFKKKENNGRKPRARLKKWIIFLIIAALLVTGAWLWLRRRASRGREAMENMSGEYVFTTVEARDISSTLSGSGSLQPADSYTVISLVSGEILFSDFSTGDTVSKDDVLYKIDSSNTDTSIRRAENSLDKTRRDYEELVASEAELTVTAPIGGVVTGLSAHVGSNVNKNAVVATIENIDTMYIVEYYSTEYSDDISVGCTAHVTIADSMMKLVGRVCEVSSLTRISETGMECFGVTVEITNPGSLSIGDKAECCLGENADIWPTITDDNGLEASESASVQCGISGTVAEISVRNNERIEKGEVIMRLSSDTLSDEILSAAESLEDAELSLENQYDTLENYTITAPINGTIVDKYYKEGENAESGKTLCTIFDLSSLTMTLNVDELDIMSVEVGQKATITVEAVPDKIYEGVITEVSINATASSGVTTYPVTIKIDDPEGILPGMNAEVSVIVQEAKGVVSVPAAAVATGGSVLVKTEDGSTGQGAPEGYSYVRVETGVSDGDWVEIVSGLEIGDEIAYVPDTVSQSSSFPMGEMPGGMPSGNMGGGMPGGSMGGGTPGGNMGGGGRR